jgi:hypothetical protein
VRLLDEERVLPRLGSVPPEPSLSNRSSGSDEEEAPFDNATDPVRSGRVLAGFSFLSLRHSRERNSSSGRLPMAMTEWDWPAQLETCLNRIAELERRIAIQEQIIQRHLDRATNAEFARRALVIKQDSLARVRVCKHLIETRMAARATEQRAGDLVHLLSKLERSKGALGGPPLGRSDEPPMTVQRSRRRGNGSAFGSPFLP